MTSKRDGTVWRQRGWAALALAIALALGTVGGPATHRHRYHDHVAGAGPDVVAPLDGVTHAETRRWPHVPVSADPPPAGWFYAVSVTEVAAALDDLPPAWREAVGGVRLCPSPDGEVTAETDGETIQLHYVVDRAGRATVAPGESADEEAEFGGIPVQEGHRLWVLWPRHDLLRTYVLKHLLMHEIGHHLAPAGLDDDADERWAEAFAFHYYDPTRPQGQSLY